MPYKRYGHDYKYDRVKRRMRENVKREVAKKTKEQILNEAIHKLLLIKKQRIDDHYPEARIKRVQVEIDILLKMKREITLAARFIRWRENNE